MLGVEAGGYLGTDAAKCASHEKFSVSWTLSDAAMLRAV